MTPERSGGPIPWRCGRFTFGMDSPLVMGILNITPDSFSDGGLHPTVASACEHARAMRRDGADIIDVGGESTRPGSAAVSPAEESERVLPVVRALADEGIPVSIDTRNPETAEVCLAAGACIINDVSGFRDPRMVELAARTDAGVVIMHMLGEPGTMQADPHYEDVVEEIASYLVAQATTLEDAGVASSRICIDPGIGFGKTLSHNLDILRQSARLAALGYPLLIGASRKRMIGEVLRIDDPSDRLEGSLAIAAWAAGHGAHVLRVHDVRETVRFLRMTAAIEGISKVDE